MTELEDFRNNQLSVLREAVWKLEDSLLNKNGDKWDTSLELVRFALNNLKEGPQKTWEILPSGFENPDRESLYNHVPRELERPTQTPEEGLEERRRWGLSSLMDIGP